LQEYVFLFVAQAITKDNATRKKNAIYTGMTTALKTADENQGWVSLLSCMLLMGMDAVAKYEFGFWQR
jgi:hypothetical protein